MLFFCYLHAVSSLIFDVSLVRRFLLNGIWFLYAFRMVSLTLWVGGVSPWAHVCFECAFAPILAHAEAWEHLTTMVVAVQGPPALECLRKPEDMQDM